ncbi:hypothetical protein HY491_00830 [Candidatus Woesearchaeota archaeon]|nr:hypothetical protein [Candidatus Woesearchaeota archaeon]
MQEQEVGRIIHFYTNISVGIVQLSGAIKVGDIIHVKGATTDFTQKVASMQVSHAQVAVANPGESIGIQVKDHVREHDIVYKVTGETVMRAPAMPKKAAARSTAKPKKKAIKRTRAKKKASRKKAAKRPVRRGKAKRGAKQPKQRKAKRKSRRK